MSKREKIILIVMALTIIGGGYIYFFDSPPPKTGGVVTGQDVQKLNTFMADMAKNLKTESLSEKDMYIFAQAGSEWGKDPFLPSGMVVTPKTDINKDKGFIPNVKLTYSGYLTIGDRKMAIIDGMEYDTGETLKQGGYFVKSISPVQVVIGVSESNNEFILPLEETD